MKILIKEIIGGSTNGKPGAFYDYTIKGLTENSLEIKIFDHEFKDFHKYVNKKIDLLLTPFIDKDPPGFLIEGDFIGGYIVPEEWSDSNKNQELEGLYCILTNYGEFILVEDDVNDFNLKKGEQVKFYADRIDILARQII
ncbi:MAG: hypothetical protein ACFFDF_12225 [Candidatus Odinarchaeota archaeon]